MRLLWFMCVCGLATHNVDSAKILGFFSVPSISHQIMFQPIWRELSLRGHEVTVLSPNVLKDPKLTNLTEIDVNFSYDVFKSTNFIQGLASTTSSEWTKKWLIFDTFETIIKGQIEHEPFKRIIEDKNRHFDLILIEAVHPLHVALGARFNAPVVGIISHEPPYELFELLRNPTHPLLYPDLMVTLDRNPPFQQRVSTFVYHSMLGLYYNWIYLPKIDKLAKQYFGKGIPYIGDLQKNISLVISNTNPFMFKVRPNLPNFVEVSQMHINRKKKPLPQDIQQFLDSSPEGVVYFSLGSNVKSVELPPRIRDMVLRALGALPYKVLWKWENDHLPNKPKNVFIKKWLPQQDVLAHPYIKAFVTQAGLQSMEEAIFNGVPMVALPFIVDQAGNAAKIASLGIGVSLMHYKMSENEFSNAIKEVIENKQYKDNVQRLHRLMLDQPIAGLEKAIWWIEYVLRNGDTSHFKSPALDMPFYQYHMLDVIGFLIVATLVVIFVFVKLVIFTFSTKVEKIKRS